MAIQHLVLGLAEGSVSVWGPLLSYLSHAIGRVAGVEQPAEVSRAGSMNGFGKIIARALMDLDWRKVMPGAM
jgi:hypothetical protein